MHCKQYMCYFQQKDVTIKFWKKIKTNDKNDNILYYFPQYDFNLPSHSVICKYTHRHLIELMNI